MRSGATDALRGACDAGIDQMGQSVAVAGNEDVGQVATERRWRRVVVDGVSLDAMREADVVEHVVTNARAGVGGLVVTANVDHLRQISSGGRLADAYRSATLAVADGQPIVWAARLQGERLPERVTGASLLWTLAEAAADAGVSVGLVGGQGESSSRAATKLAERWPHLDVRLVAAPRVSGDPTPAEVDRMCALVRGARPSIVFLAFGAPKQELLGAALRVLLPDVWFLGVGASFEMAGGRVRRAPHLLQRGGLEWAWRLAREPRRLAHRYLVQDLPYVPRLLAGALRQRGRPVQDRPPADHRSCGG